MPIKQVNELWKYFLNCISCKSGIINNTMKCNVSYFLLFPKRKLKSFEISCA